MLENETAKSKRSIQLPVGSPCDAPLEREKHLHTPSFGPIVVVENSYISRVCNITMLLTVSASPVDDIAYLARSEHRIPTLVALAVRLRSRSELCELTGVSSSTVRRTLCDFEERNWIRKVEYRYETTELGAYVASAMTDLIARVETERKLRDVWHWLPDEVIGSDIELFADAVVTVPEFGAPRRTADRFAELVEATETIRTFVPTNVEPDAEVLVRNALDGMEWELICSSDMIEALLTVHSEPISGAIESGNLTVLTTDDDLPCACAVFDDHVALGGFDHETGIVRAMIDTDAPDARRWAEELYRSYRREARPLALEPAVK